MKADKEGSAGLTRHAQERMAARGISQVAVQAALNYGRIAHARGAEIHAIGRKEVILYADTGIDLRRFEGIQVVCAVGGPVLTVYRNNDFRGLRSSRHHRRAA